MLKKITSLLLLLFMNALVLLAAEGICSLILSVLDAPKPTYELFETRHTQYDPQLGWAHIPNKTFAAVYGKNTKMTINGQGFRNVQNFAVGVDPGKIRIICNGDSFTLGFGVTDGLPWCDQLEQVNPKLETVNMGQGGYGIDQAYLWFQRDGFKLNHHIHLLAFILDDFFRMEGGSFAGYGKPYLDINSDGQLVIKNTPVPKGFPRRSYRTPDFLKHFAWVRTTGIYRLLLRCFWSLRSFEMRHNKTGINQHLREVSLRVFEQLQEEHRRHGSKLVLVFLPRKQDAYDAEVKEWQSWLKTEAEKRHILYLDLIEEMKTISVKKWSDFFKYNDHYSIQGNAFVAFKINEYLSRLGLIS